MTLKINQTEYQLKYTIRTFFVFETLTERSFDANKLQDNYILFYACLLANNQDTFKLTFDEFVNVCDEDVTLFQQFTEFLITEINLRNQKLSGKEDDVKKKITKKK